MLAQRHTGWSCFPFLTFIIIQPLPGQARRVDEVSRTPFFPSRPTCPEFHQTHRSAQDDYDDHDDRAFS
uniref:Putative secreted protein n=1 Tax=Anopheles triannulatus TaxID=58253 RepID=A0A2M4B7P1_9DIPT